MKVQPVRVLREHDGPDGSGAPRRPEHLGPERRRPLLHAGAARRAARPGGATRRRGHADQPALRRRARRRLLPGRPARALQHHRPRLRRHRPDDRLHAVDGRRAPGGDDAFATDDRRPADHGRPELRRDGQLADRRRARARRRRSRPTTCCSSSRTATSNNNFGSNVETALDIEAAHGVATHVGDEVLRLRLRHDDAAGLRPHERRLQRQRRRHARGDRGRRERPDAAQRLEQLGLRRRGRVGRRRPVPGRDREHPRARRGGRDDASTSRPATRARTSPATRPTARTSSPSAARAPTRRATPATWSTSHDVERRRQLVLERHRPARRGRPAPASRPTRRARAASIPDVSAVADPNTGVRFTRHATPTGGTAERPGRRHEPRGAGDERPPGRDPELRRRADLPGPDAEDGLRRAGALPARQRPPTTQSYFRDVECGNTANPTSGPDGDAATKGWDAATGWGEPDWFNFSIGYALQLGATNLSAPASLTRHFAWTLREDAEQLDRARASRARRTSTCYAVGAASGATPWYGKFLAGRRVGRREHVLQVDRRRRDAGSRRTATCSRSTARAARRA